MDINFVAMVLMESFGAVFFLLVFLFVMCSRRINGKMKACWKVPAGTMTDESCFSYEWAVSHMMKPRKIIYPSPFLLFVLVALFFVIAIPFVTIFYSIGYSMLLALIGCAIFFDEDAFQAYSYGRAVQRVTLGELDKEDESYMEIAREALQIGAIRFLIMGATFAFAGPFIPQIFEGLCYAFALYMGYTLFLATEVASNISIVLTIVTAAIFTVVLLYLPELVLRTLLRMLKRERERRPTFYISEFTRERSAELHKHTGH